MKRKKWTPKEEVTEADLKFRERRKWQIALRRYILERNPSSQYAPYFGLDIETFRGWIETKFDNGLGWDNFGSSWQFDHIVPLSYFDLSEEDDLRLCWNFINIQIVRLDVPDAEKIDLLAAGKYFQALYYATRYEMARLMVKKLRRLEEQISTSGKPADFITTHLELINTLSCFTSNEYDRLNKGEKISDILLEKEIIKKWGG